MAYNHSYNLSVSGGTKDIKYYVSGNITRDQGIMVNSEFNKISFRAKLDANLSKYIKVGVNLNPSYGERERPFRDQINYTRWWSCFPVYHTQETVDFLAANGKYGYNVGDYTQPSDFSGLRFIGTTPAGDDWNDIGTISSSSNTQPVWVNAGGSKKQKNYRLQASAYLTANIVKGLSFTSTNSVFVGYSDYSEFQRTGLLSAGAINQATARTNLTTNFLTENMVNYNAVFAKHHNLALLAGVTYQAIKYNASQMIGTGLPTENIKTLNQATTILSGDNSWTRIDPSRTIASYLARATYAYQDKYLFSASVRADGSSRFGPENRWGFFPSVSAGWRISEEKFLASAKNWLDQLKLRLSWGITGNDDIEALAYENIISQANYELGNAVAPGMSPTDDALGNPTIGWEQTNEVNAGLDFSIFAGRFAITADYYYAITDGLLLKQSSMAFTGHNLYWNNIGTVRNSGFEIELNTVNIDKRNFKWKTTFNIAHNDPRLLGLGGESQLLTHPSVNYDYYIAIVGQKPIQYYGYKTDGVWKSKAEIDAAIADGYEDKLSSFAAGGLKIRDMNGDKIIDDHDKTTIGDPYPDFTWSFTNAFSFYGVDISIMFQGAQGIELYNDDGRYNENVRTSAKWNTPDRWVSPNNPGDGLTPFETNGIHKSLTDYVIEDGSYLALRNATIGYTVPTKWITKTKIFKGLRVYFACENPLYLWNLGNTNANKYRGINPEARKEYNNPLTDGLQNGSFAVQSSYVFGLNLTF
ncbi:hypothetical protein FACS1894178_4240 [Bacteroidia bacterium]|nr:hypothetical protein FACS1894178_4240 [Bacteroidia bacterium]